MGQTFDKESARINAELAISEGYAAWLAEVAPLGGQTNTYDSFVAGWSASTNHMVTASPWIYGTAGQA